MPRTWNNDAAPYLDATNLNALEGELSTSLWSAAALSTKTANYTATTSDKVLIFNGSNLTATLPDPTTVANRIYIIKNIHTTTSLTVNSAGTSKTIDGVASVPVFPNVTITVVSNGTAWLAISGLELLATATAAVNAYANVASSEPAFAANSSGVTNRTAFRATTASGTGYQLETGQTLSGTFYRMFAITNNGTISRLGNTDYTITVVSGNPQDGISGNGIVTDTNSGLTYAHRGASSAFPRWHLQPLGYFGQPQTRTASYTVDFRDTLNIGNGTSITFTLPDPTTAGVTGRKFEFKNINSTSLTIVSAGTSKTIDGAASKSLAQWEKLTVISDGTQWLIL